MARPTLPSAVTSNLVSEDYYETTLAQPLAAADTDIYPETMPTSVQAFGVLDPKGTAPEIVFWNSQGANFLRCPSATNGQGRGVFQTSPQDWDSGTTFGLYTVSAYIEAIVTGIAMQDGFLQARHFSSNINPNNWTGLGSSLVLGGINQNREATYVVTGDVTNTLGVGMKLQLPRVTSMGYNCLPLTAASSQYASKSGPSGITFTGAFTCEAWVYLNSYTGTDQFIVNRVDAAVTTGGWNFSVAADGRAYIRYGTTTNFTDFITRRALPTKKWVHVAGVITSVSSKTGLIYINGESVPVSSAAQSSTTLTQASVDLRVGAASATPANTYFDGKIEDVRVWSAARTQQNILDNMHKRLLGSETNLVAYYKLDTDLNDSTANNNHLTAAGSAALATGSAFSATEYGVVTKLVYSAGSTTITLFTGQGVAPAENLSNVAYSSSKNPYGFPSQSGFWTVQCIYKTQTSTSVNNTTAQLAGAQITLPTGSWRRVGHRGYYLCTASAIANLVSVVGLSTATGSFSDDLQFTRGATPNISLSAGEHDGWISTQQDYDVTTPTTLYLVSKTTQNNTVYYAGASVAAIIEAECAYI